MDDKYSLDRGCVFISGTQALVRLPLMQLERGHAAGLNTAGYITGYRVPLAGLDQQLSVEKKFYANKPIVRIDLRVKQREFISLAAVRPSIGRLRRNAASRADTTGFA